MVELLNWIDSLSQNNITMIALLGMLIMGFSAWLYTRSLVVAIITPECINCLNLTIIITEPLLQLGTKPFMPIWISLVLLFIPFITVLSVRLFIVQSEPF